MIAETIKQLVAGRSLEREQMHEVFGQVMDGHASDVQKAALLVALRMKGETADEITGAAVAMRERVTPLDIGDLRDVLVDTCGTGGDGRGTFNISTIAAIVAAGAGAKVAKHGNRAVSSSCGSADLLGASGVNLDLDATRTAEVLRKIGIAFLFAPKLHPAMSAVASVRRELGVRTIFNILGPLTNPAFARRQVLGVYAEHLVDTVAHVLAELGAIHALVVHSRDGLDEISISAPTIVREVRDGEVGARYEITAEELDLSSCPIEDVAGGDIAHNVAIARKVLQGGGGAARQYIVAANAGAAIYVAGLAPTLRDGVALAQESVGNGRALETMAALVKETNA